MQTRSKIIDIAAAQSTLGKSLCSCLPFVHAMSGCDTISAFFGIGKVKAMKVIEKSKELQVKTTIFGHQDVSKENMTDVGEQFILSLYGARDSVQSLNELRYLNMMSTRYVPFERLPPTTRSAYFHCLRVHLQTSTWLSLRTVMDKEDSGFVVKNGELQPIITDMKPAPPELLQVIRCSCCKGEQLCLSCSCSKKRLPCSIHCKCGGECENGL